MRVTLWAVVGMLVVAAPIAAQRPAARKKAAAKKPAAAEPARNRWRLSGVAVKGAKVFSAEAIVRASGLKPGQQAGVADLQEATAQLTDAGAFETLSYRYTTAGDSLEVTFEVQEVVDLYPVGFERMPLAETELLKRLSESVPLFGPRVPATGAMVKRIVAALAQIVKAPVVGRLLTKSEGRLVMTFRPAEAPPAIAFVRFEGSAVLRAEDLQKAFYQVAVGEPYTEERLRELLDHGIRPLFEEKGRLQAGFGPFRTEESKNPAGLIVTVPVQDGDEFQFGAVQFAGNALLDDRELARLAKLEEGELANFALVKKAVADIEHRYRRQGFMKVKIAMDRKIIEKTKTVEVSIAVEEGDRYMFRRLEIKGLDINSAAAVRKRWGIQRGQPYDAAYAEIFLKRIEEEAMFDRLAKTLSRVTVDEGAKVVDVELEFVGEKPAPRKSAIP